MSRANERSNGACQEFSTTPKLESQFSKMTNIFWLCVHKNFKLLQEVNLSFNEIRKDGGIDVAESMANHDNLEKLDLGG